MYKVAVVDDDELWCLAVQRFFRKEFEVFIFTKMTRLLQTVELYDLVIIDFCIPPASYEKNMDGKELITHLKQTLPNPPILVLATGFLSKNDSEIGREICPLADAFFAKDAGLEEILQQTKQLLASKRHKLEIPD
jgi:CheY-like chemotaxis protein